MWKYLARPLKLRNFLDKTCDEQLKQEMEAAVDKKREQLAAKYGSNDDTVNGPMRNVAYNMLKNGVHKRFLALEVILEDSNFTVDMLIKVDRSEMLNEGDDEKQDWKYKGIVVEYDGPSHFMSGNFNNERIFRYNNISIVRH